MAAYPAKVDICTLGLHPAVLPADHEPTRSQEDDTMRKLIPFLCLVTAASLNSSMLLAEENQRDESPGERKYWSPSRSDVLDRHGSHHHGREPPCGEQAQAQGKGCKGRSLWKATEHQDRAHPPPVSGFRSFPRRPRRDPQRLLNALRPSTRRCYRGIDCPQAIQLHDRLLKLPSLSLFSEKATHSFQIQAFRGRMSARSARNALSLGPWAETQVF